MSFWVYENWTHEKAIVHNGDCSYCNDGRGIHGKSSDKNGEWHGPFTDRDAAFQRAKATKRDDVRSCKACAV